MTNINKIFQILTEKMSKYDMPVINFIEAKTTDPFKILLTIILSARTRDSTTIKVVNGLFEKVKDVKDLQKINIIELRTLLYPIGFYNNKASLLKRLPPYIKEGIPQTIEGLMELPGVGRKTANLVFSAAFKKPGICVDVHVHRILNRTGYIKTKSPLETEMVLREKLPKRLWIPANRLLVTFGQNVCTPVSPECSVCPVYKECKRAGVQRHR